MLIVDVLLRGGIFLLPGIAAGLLFRRRWALDPLRLPAVTLVSSAAVAYLAFWPYLISARVGKAASLLIGICALIVVVRESLARKLHFSEWRVLAICFLLMSLLTTGYSALGYLYRYSDDPLIQAEQRFLPLPPDNLIPYVFAARLYQSVPVRPWLYGEWKSSDRPPLQAGATLFQLPLWKAGQREFQYTTLAVFLQSMWIAAVWLLLRSGGVARRTIVLVLGFCVASGTFLLFTCFVWPKLLAAALFLLGLVFLKFIEGGVRTCTAFEAAFAGAAMGLAMLSHPGVAFTILALPVVLAVTRTLPPWRQIVWGLVALLAFLLPWNLYQKFYDPPGDRLLKWHLAGAREIDSRSFPAALIDAYTKPAISQIVDAKLQNFETLWGTGPLEQMLAVAHGRAVLDSKALAHSYVVSNFFYLSSALGLLSVGLIVWLYGRVFRGRSFQAQALSGAQRSIFLALVAIVIWCLIMYSPKSTHVHEGSMATVALLFVGLGIMLAEFAPRFTGLLLVLQAGLLFPLYVVEKPFVSGGVHTVWAGLDLKMAFWAAASFICMILLGWKSGFCSGEALQSAEGDHSQGRARDAGHHTSAPSKKAAEHS